MKKDAVRYAMQENSMQNTCIKGIVKITILSDIKVYPCTSLYHN